MEYICGAEKICNWIRPSLCSLIISYFMHSRIFDCIDNIILVLNTFAKHSLWTFSCTTLCSFRHSFLLSLLQTSNNLSNNSFWSSNKFFFFDYFDSDSQNILAIHIYSDLWYSIFLDYHYSFSYIPNKNHHSHTMWSIVLPTQTKH